MNLAKKHLILLVMAAIPVFATAAIADDCFIIGEITAADNTEAPGMGAYVYTLTIEWDTGTPHALSHFDLLLDLEFGECICYDFETALNWANPAGYSTGSEHHDPCTVYYDLYLNCNGDPSLPDVNEPLLKFEPDESGGCEPDETGEGVFTFYSDYAPAPVAPINSFMVDKHSGQACWGMVSGVFPGLPCDPVAADNDSWGAVKGLYR